MLVASVQEGLEGPPIQVNPMTFHPNLVISGGAPYAENEWKSLKIGNENFLVSLILLEFIVHAVVWCMQPLPDDQFKSLRRRSEEIKGTLGYSSILQEGEVAIHIQNTALVLSSCPPRANAGRKPVDEFGDNMNIGGGSRRQFQSLLNGYPLTSVVNLFMEHEA
ncbi:hypothetical protein RHMOL_Rhmol01G0119400 [Rhododendron molle]|uniref:Uncharacterized protein n=1 Tax=Rhododendron molle TaxID=49168 RepID=A0ACC0Q1X0_RHOML|nr:hypothetical protein RHMOL_Rhmol01G0119400 [Rhododendron molle]